VIFPYGKHKAAVRMNPNIAESESALRRDRPRLTIVSDCIETAVSELRVHDRAARDLVLAAAVLMHSVADVRGWWSDLDRFTIGEEPPPQAHPPALVGSRLQPVDIISVDLYGRKSH